MLGGGNRSRPQPADRDLKYKGLNLNTQDIQYSKVGVSPMYRFEQDVK